MSNKDGEGFEGETPEGTERVVFPGTVMRQRLDSDNRGIGILTDRLRPGDYKVNNGEYEEEEPPPPTP